MPKHAILFVCTGNTCRSPMAEVLFKKMVEKEGIPNVEVWSRGMAALAGQPMSQGSIDALQQIGITAPAHQSGPISRKDVEKATLILTMEEKQRQQLLITFPEASSKTFRLKQYAEEDENGDVEDPIGGSPSDYQKCRIELQNCLLGLFDKLKKNIHPGADAL